MFTDKVIIVVPTYRRFAFYPILLRCFVHQDYPSSLLEMIILDDSPPQEESEKRFHECISMYPEDVRHRVHFIHSDEHFTIGAKRNRLNELAIQSGAEYIACMDDDDYYFPDRISYTMRQLKRKPSILIAGCNSAIIFFPLQLQQEMKNGNIDALIARDIRNRVFSTEIVYKSCTIGNPHTLPGNICNASMMYHKNYLLNHSYSNESLFGEESAFLNGFKEEVIHLPCERVFVCIAHGENTVEKYSMIRTFHPTMIQASTLIEDVDCMRFYRSNQEDRQIIALSEYQRVRNGGRSSAKVGAAAASAESSSGESIFTSAFPSIRRSKRLAPIG